MLGKKSMHANACHDGNFIGADFGMDLSFNNNLPENWRDFNKKYIPVFMEKNPGKSKVVAGLACGALHTICKGINTDDIVLSPDGTGSYLIGEVNGDYHYHPGDILPHRRTIQWYSKTVARASMSQPLQYSTGSIGTVSNVTKYADEIESLIKDNKPSLRNNEKVLWGSSAFIFLLLVSFLVGTIERNKVWKDEVSLWADAKQKAPFLVRPYNNLGEAYDKLGNYDMAISEFEAALRLNPNYFFALSNLGNVYGKKKEYTKAILYTKQALQKKPDYAPGHYNLAKALHMKGSPEKALVSYRSAIKYNPYFEEAFFNIGFLALELRQPKESVENFKNFLKMQPRHPKAHFGLGTSYAMMGKYENAKQYYENAIAYDPEFLSPYINLANLHMTTGNSLEAKNLLKTVLSKKPGLAGVHKNLGLIFMQENDGNNASKHFREYLRLVPMAPDAPAIKSFLQNNNQKQNEL